MPAAFGVDAAYDRSRDAEIREALGQVFTPPALANALARLVGAERPGTVLDPAVGDGSLLLAVADVRRAEGSETAAVLDTLRGWDIDPVAAWLCRLSLLEWGLRDPVGPVPDPLRVDVRDLFEPGMAADRIVCNPPYLEAKRMRRAAPGLKERLKRQFPQLQGAFDLYVAVAYRALELAPSVGLILPNKVCQGRYARAFRAQLASERRVAGLVDLSRMQPRPFPGTSVYPVLLHLEATETTRVARVHDAEQLETLALDTLDPGDWAAVGGEQPWFVPFDTWSLLTPTLARPRLDEVAHVVSTCSFHKKGLRERYVTQTRREESLPYLGGPSRARQTEVAPFAERWSGWWIDYDTEALKAIGNPLPPLERFQQPKVVFNQHDRRMTAWADLEGRFVTKDVYPIAWPRDARWSVEALTAVFNSTVFTALYNTIYQGIVVGGETYHYLPAFLKTIPMPDRSRLGAVEARVRALQADFDPDAWEALDVVVTRAYGLDPSVRDALIATHLTRVGAPAPGRP